MKKPKSNEVGTEIECPACDGTGFPKVRQPHQPFSRRALQIAGAASIHVSACGNRLQSCLAPLPLDLDVSASPGSGHRLQGARGLSTVPLLPAISNCVHGRTRRVGGTTFPYNDSLPSRSW